MDNYNIMDKDFNYDLLPHDFAHCLNNTCKLANECLRCRATQYIPAERRTVTIINPVQTNPASEECPFFKLDQVQQFALGMTNLLAHIPHNDAVVIKQQMLAYFGRTHFYRLWRKERFFTLEQQEYVRQLFLKRGLQETPVFDEYVGQYEW